MEATRWVRLLLLMAGLVLSWATARQDTSAWGGSALVAGGGAEDEAGQDVLQRVRVRRSANPGMYRCSFWTVENGKKIWKWRPGCLSHIKQVKKFRTSAHKQLGKGPLLEQA